MNNSSLFVATPISAFETNTEYVTFRLWVTNLVNAIIANTGIVETFCVACMVKNQDLLDSPLNSLLDDIHELDCAEHFILIYPKPIATSALIELGYALAKEKNITIVHPKSVKLPFMASQLDTVYENVTILSISDFDEIAFDEIIKHIQRQTVQR